MVTEDSIAAANVDQSYSPGGAYVHPYLLHGSWSLPPPNRGPVRPLACNRYYCAQLIAKPKAACALRFSWAATSSNLGL